MERLPEAAFMRADESADELFYRSPRLVTHIDAGAIAALGALYRDLLPPGGAILDLMSSWVSHLPANVTYAQVVGHGLNAEELSENPRLDDYFLQNLNTDPILPFDADTFDGAAISVSVQYLTRPYEVMSELARILKPGAPLIISFSNRCFPTKAVNVWMVLDGFGHGQLVSHYLEETGAFERVGIRDVVAEGSGGDPLWAVVGHAAAGGEQLI